MDLIKKIKNRLLRYSQLLYKFPRIYSKIRTIKLIKEKSLSVTRFGDGEINALIGEEILPCNDRLLKAFRNENEKLLVCFTDCIPTNYFKFKPRVIEYYMDYYLQRYERIKKLFNFKYHYGNSCFSRFYMDYKYCNAKVINRLVKATKDIWDNKNVIIVEGKNSLNGCGNDLFNNTKDIKRILCPNKNAFLLTDEIKQKIIEIYKPGAIVVLSIGYASSIISSELTNEKGIQCIDLGNFDIEYMWYVNGCKEKIVIGEKNSAEAPKNFSSRIKIEYDEKEYYKQIVGVVDFKSSPYLK